VRQATEETREKYEMKGMRREGENEQIKKQKLQVMKKGK